MMANQPDSAWVIAESKRSLCEGVLYEPRAYWDFADIPSIPIEVADPSLNIIQGHEGSLVNTEGFAVRITHMVFSILSILDELATLQVLTPAVLMRVRAQDSYYQSRELVPLSAWSTEVPTMPDWVVPGQAVWHFERPVILSTRDTIAVDVRTTTLGAVANATRTVDVTFQGVGYITGRPYTLEGDVQLTSLLTTGISAVNFRNDGSEPIALHTLVVRGSSLSSDFDPLGDTRNISIQLRQIGNGTNQVWIHPPLGVSPPATDIPAVLLGADAGQAIVHRVPGSGFIWEPGEGINVDFANTVPVAMRVGVSCLGYIAVR